MIPLRRARTRPGLAPEIPADATRLAFEPLPWMLVHDAGRWWRRAAAAWAPSLDALRAAGVERVDVADGAVVVTRRNAVYRATMLPRIWVPVIVAALTAAELPAVRRALARGATRFTAEAPCPNP